MSPIYSRGWANSHSDLKPMSFLDRIGECNVHDLSGFRPFVVGDVRVGWVRPNFAERLARLNRVFDVAETQIKLADSLDDFETRSKAVDGVLRQLRADGDFSAWRDESYPVVNGFSSPPLLRMERAAVPRFGVRAYGVHMNGFVRKPDGLHMWIGRRSRDKPTYPGMLDNMVAGGQPLGLSLAKNLAKECDEEAGIPAVLAACAVPVGAITYCSATPDGLKPDVLFCYDLELPVDFMPRNRDGELETFYLWPASQVAAVVRDTHEFKFNCNLVIIDFLIRHGLIPPEHPDYLDLVRGLHAEV